MAKRKKRFGAVARQPGKGSQYKPRRFNVAVSVMRTGKSYSAVACPKHGAARSLSNARYRAALDRCGNAVGPTPTSAVKGALAALARRLK